VRRDLLPDIGDEALVLGPIAGDLVEDGGDGGVDERVEVVEERRQDARALGADRVGSGRWIGGATGDRPILTSVPPRVKASACSDALDSTSCDGSTMRGREDWVAPTMRREAVRRKLGNRRATATRCSVAPIRDGLTTSIEPTSK
jgi:hypothetical protein